MDVITIDMELPQEAIITACKILNLSGERCLADTPVSHNRYIRSFRHLLREEPIAHRLGPPRKSVDIANFFGRLESILGFI